MARALSLGLAHPIEIAAPFSAMHKSDVIRLGVELGVPLELTLSCMNPRERHCTAADAASAASGVMRSAKPASPTRRRTRVAAAVASGRFLQDC